MWRATWFVRTGKAFLKRQPVSGKPDAGRENKPPVPRWAELGKCERQGGGRGNAEVQGGGFGVGLGGSQAPPQPSLVGYGKQFGFSPEYNKQPLKCVTQRGTGSDSHLKCNSGCCVENAPKTWGEVRRLEPGQASSIESDFAIQGAGGNVGRLEGGLWASRGRGQGCCSTAYSTPLPPKMI